MSDCIFCKIANKEIKTDIIYEDKDSMAFFDKNPKAPLHILIIPKKHIPSVDNLSKKDENLMGHLILVAKKVAKMFPQASNGYKLVINVGPGGGQVINHIHVHLLAGENIVMP